VFLTTGAVVPSTISSHCCSIPFTLNGHIHYSCADNGGCFYGDREWKQCRQPAGSYPAFSCRNGSSVRRRIPPPTASSATYPPITSPIQLLKFLSFSVCPYYPSLIRSFCPIIVPYQVIFHFNTF